MKLELLFDILNRALKEELGVVIETNNPHSMSMQLHEAKKGLSIYDQLIIAVPSTPNTVSVVKKTVELDDV